MTVVAGPNCENCSGVPAPCCGFKINQILTLTLTTDCDTYTIPMSLISLTAHTATWQTQPVTFQCKQMVCTNVTGSFELFCVQGSPWEFGITSGTCSGTGTSLTVVCPTAIKGFSAAFANLSLSCCLNHVQVSIAG